MYYNLILRVIIIYAYMCHLRATQVLAWVCVALPRGLACHIASTRVPREIKPLFVIFLFVLIDLKSKINSKKSGKIPKNYKIHNFQNTTPN